MDGEKKNGVPSQAFEIALPCMKMNQENPDEGQSENDACKQQCTVETGDELIYVSPIPEDIEAAATLFDELVTGSPSLDMICNSDILQRINRKTKAEKDAMQDQQLPSCGCNILICLTFFKHPSNPNALVTGSCTFRPCMKCYLI
jgi:hypothetical protein